MVEDQEVEVQTFLEDEVMVHEHLHSSQVLTVPRLLRKIYEDQHHLQQMHS